MGLSSRPRATWHLQAFAKLHGSYEALEGGSTDEALAALTGYPTERLMLRAAADTAHGRVSSQSSSGGGMEEEADPDVLWGRLLSYHEAGFLCGASCGADAADADADAGRAAAEAMGLLSEHAYSLLQVYTRHSTSWTGVLYSTSAGQYSTHAYSPPRPGSTTTTTTPITAVITTRTNGLGSHYRHARHNASPGPASQPVGIETRTRLARRLARRDTAERCSPRSRRDLGAISARSRRDLGAISQVGELAVVVGRAAQCATWRGRHVLDELRRFP